MRSLLMLLIMALLFIAVNHSSMGGDVSKLGSRAQQSGIPLILVDIEDTNYHLPQLPLSPAGESLALSDLRWLVSQDGRLGLRRIEDRYVFGFTDVEAYVRMNHQKAPLDPLRRRISIRQARPAHLGDLVRDLFPRTVTFSNLEQTYNRESILLGAGDWNLFQIVSMMADQANVPVVFIVYRTLDRVPMPLPGTDFQAVMLLPKYEAEVDIKFSLRK